jgi:putative FmdB family regulatory protein
MPVYQFVCEKHGEFEKITIKAEWDEIRCPKCGNKPKMNKKMPLELNGTDVPGSFRPVVRLLKFYCVD